MRLYEHEAKALLAKHGISVPEGTLLTSPQEAPQAPCVLKAQVLFGNRAAQGGIIICKTRQEVERGMSTIFGLTLKGEQVKEVLAEELLTLEKNYYVSFLFDTAKNAPVLLYSADGGSGIEERSAQRIVIDASTGLTKNQAHLVNAELAPVLLDLWRVFAQEDCKLLEINPLAKTPSGFVCIDARIDLDDTAKTRHKEWQFAARPSPLGRPYTPREIAIKTANDADHHGTIKYIELDGDIVVLAAGGGGSLTAVDSLIEAGGKPSNYTEFSGDPTEEKMYVLTKQALSKEGINGCWIVGAVANFSRVDTMMSGVVRALEEVKPKFPVIVRRAGPFEKEGLAILTAAAKKYGWDLEVHGAESLLTQTAPVIVHKAKTYAEAGK